MTVTITEQATTVPDPTRPIPVAPRCCSCGCGFTLSSGMTVRLINGAPYVLGCISEPVLIDENGTVLTGPDVTAPGPFRH